MVTNTLVIAKVLSILIDNAQITEAHLARMVGMPRATINKIRSGKILNPKSSTLNLIAQYFNVTVDQLIGNAPLVSGRIKKFIHIPIIDPSNLIVMQFIFNKINFINHDSWILLEEKIIKSKIAIHLAYLLPR
jgi:transcriptional regulator with XRE-family HTH domain